MPLAMPGLGRAHAARRDAPPRRRRRAGNETLVLTDAARGCSVATASRLVLVLSFVQPADACRTGASHESPVGQALVAIAPATSRSALACLRFRIEASP
jgi:hypothetical protein